MKEFKFKQDAAMKLNVGSFFSIYAKSKKDALEQAKELSKANIIEVKPGIIEYLYPFDGGGVEIEDLELISPEENGGEPTLETYFIDDNDEETLIGSNQTVDPSYEDNEDEDNDYASFVSVFFAVVDVGINTYKLIKAYKNGK